MNDKNFKYIGCNTAFLNFIGKPTEELLGKDDFEIFDHELACTFRHNDKLMLAEGKIRTSEEWVSYPNGDKILQKFSAHLEGHIRLTDHLFRIGGEEFTICLGLCEVTKDDCINSIAKPVDNLLYQAK